jgi:hypothetical protein
MGILVYIGACLWANWIQISIYTSVLVSIPDFDILACLVCMYDHIGFWYDTGFWYVYCMSMLMTIQVLDYSIL